MPRESTDRRRSSLSTRRGPPRQHIPFRADDLARGKRTGIPVQYVDRNSDEFEPFDELMKQVDNRLPPRIKPKEKHVLVVTPVPEELDEDGEMFMDLADTGNQGNPLAHFANIGPVHALHSPRKLGVSRPITQAPDVDYDHIPFPKPCASIADEAGPSSLFKLFKSFVAPDSPLEPDFEPVNQGAYGDVSQRDDSPQSTSLGPPSKSTPLTEVVRIAVSGGLNTRQLCVGAEPTLP
ncbi:hypothetical protein PAXRUDRAFT_822038 [Paxillus rubicundulus Ve08.2h10]|uniref:Uncharacterized protein n=1 Tax=Paxillus rubicundulus Ve08.2h10 TaxID=930991 RepID=A0A0D0ECW7_9AGAM|nr:hypothetical protein PAXRUDRAFT_822038 [Paxillus rubicundulus Ve08.2h10]